MNRKLVDRTVLNNGVTLPWLAFDLHALPDGVRAQRALEAALEAGYRAFDSVTLTGNGIDLGRALRACGVDRGELVILAGLQSNAHGHDETLRAFDRGLAQLGLDYLDVCRLGGPAHGSFAQSWRALERLYAEGRVRAIGVSHFGIDQLKALLAQAEVPPAINQVELHPGRPQRALARSCAARNVQLQARPPLPRCEPVGNTALARIAAKHGRTTAQIVLRWILQRNIVSVPRAVTPADALDHAAIFDFELDHEDIARIDQLGRDDGARVDPGWNHPPTVAAA